MKPNFALNLSHEGISLLHRATAGWLRVGDVALDDPDLNEHLRLLRQTASDLESGGLTSKLVIPNSQVLYTEIDAPGPDTAARIAQIRDGLVGLTPYDVNDLVFDWRLSGTTAQVAVVARETLQEAEAFAAEFRFNPVSFVAVPVNGDFVGEPYFGPTKHAATLLEDGEAIEPDSERLEVLGTRKARTLPEAKTTETKAEPATEDPPAAAPETTDAPVKAKPAKAKAKAKPKTAAKPEPDSKPGPESRQEAEAEKQAPMPVTFSTRRTAPPPLNPAPPAPVAAAAKPARAEPGISAEFTHRTSALDIDDVPAMPAWRSLNGKTVTPMAMTAAHTADPLPPTKRRSEVKAVARETAKVAGTALAGTFGKLGQGTAAGVRKMRARKEDVAAIDTEADALTVFGERGHAKVGGKPRFLGLILTVLLLLALVVLALWSTFFLGSDQTTLDLSGDGQPQIAAVEPIPQQPAPATEPMGSDVAAPLDTVAEEPVFAAPSAPELETAATPIESAVESALQEALTPPADAPADEPAPEGEDLALLQEPATAPDTNPPPDRVTQAPPTLAEAETRYAATGIWQLDPEPLPGATGGDRLENLSVAALDPTVVAPRASSIPAAETLGGDVRPPTLTPPPSLGTRYDLDARGLVRATPEGALSPDGVQVYLGPPPVVPRLRPGTGSPTPVPAAEPVAEAEVAPDAEAPQAEAPALDPEIERLRTIRPPARPETLQETSQQPPPDGLSPNALALIRPTIRPASLQERAAAEPLIEQDPTPEAEEPADDESAVDPGDDGTELAVIASLNPAARPRDFSSTVQKALEEAGETAAPETTVAAARVPSIPTRASVAKQATVRNAINLGQINLIGVYGSDSSRRALIRLKSGRYVKVEVGDKIDGGRVAAIGDNELRYVKGGRNITLTLPKG